MERKKDDDVEGDVMNDSDNDVEYIPKLDDINTKNEEIFIKIIRNEKKVVIFQSQESGPKHVVEITFLTQNSFHTMHSHADPDPSASAQPLLQQPHHHNP